MADYAEMQSSFADGQYHVSMKMDMITDDVFKNAIYFAFFACHEQIRTDTNFYARVDTGNMVSTTYKAGGIQITPEDLTITWDTDYAQKVYESGVPSHDVNPNASLRWAEVAEKQFGADWQRIIQKGIVESLNRWKNT